MTEFIRYRSTMVVLHWLLAIFILGALFMGLAVLDELHREHPQKILLLKAHVFTGVVILILTLLRLFVRVTGQLPEPLPEGSAKLQKLAKGMHHLLYLLTFLTALTGILLVLNAGLSSVLLGQGGILPLELKENLSHELHEVFADLLLFTIVLHTAAALYHQFVLKDGILSRMSLRK